MKFLTTLLVTAAAADAHYTFPRLVVNGKAEDRDWSVTRRTRNEQSKQGIENPTVGDIRCYSNQNAGGIMQVPAGSTIHYISTQQVNHPGPTQYYLAKVPSGQSAKTWDGSGAVWFKIFTTYPSVDKNKQQTWPGQNLYVLPNATIPASTPSGEYLLRAEHIALHMASQANKAQFYLSCSQIEITGGGNGKPGPLVSFPGAYRSNDPGIQVNIYSLASGSDYKPPGPAVWQG
ncbi:lytic polysaccharide monooxygenase [Podospora fimiseda]|uniref:lytic cellulose monooxygenase (C4-dehydrogenating) n=1 Tax=Podospora fimiseda TaxID=252190 RepID=A0AAN7BFI4_9PEZI|nr:lytic polysaccharide monooxygenase [Podospora fimiseda]